MTEVSAGRVGRAHGLDGSFYVEDPATISLIRGSVVKIGADEYEVVNRMGTEDRPIIHLAGIDTREEAAALRGSILLVEDTLEDDEYLVSDLVGCEIEGFGRVERVLAFPSCPLLEVGDEKVLVPLIRDAVKRVDVGAKIIEIDREFLGL